MSLLYKYASMVLLLILFLLGYPSLNTHISRFKANINIKERTSDIYFLEGAIDNWWIQGEGDSVFFSDMAAESLLIIQLDGCTSSYTFPDITMWPLVDFFKTKNTWKWKLEGKNRDKNGEEMQKKDEFDQKYIINIYELSNNILKYCI